jgi:HK97 family phage major capsid protein
MFVQLTKDFLGRKAGERIDVSEHDANHLIEQQVAEPLADDPLTPIVNRAIQDGMAGAVDLALKRFLENQRKTAGGNMPLGGIGDSATDDPRCGFKNFGEYALAVKDACQPGKRPDDRLAVMMKAASGMGEAFGSDGGFLVPPEFSRRLLERIYAQENLLAMTDNYTVGGNSITFPRNAETSRANGSRWGGVRAYWREEGDQATGTKPTFGRLQLNLHKLFVLVHASDELLSDVQGMALEQYLLRVASDEITNRARRRPRSRRKTSSRCGPGCGRRAGPMPSGCSTRTSSRSCTP